MTLVIIAKWDLIAYGLMQAKGQWKVINEAEPLNFYLNDKAVPDSVKYKIHLVNDIKNYAKQYLEMPVEGQYDKMFDQKGKDILWVITASLPYKLESYHWEFPFLGKVEYKGFFDEAKALHLKKELQAKGYDVRMRPVSAWSTLGWLNDPLLSKVLESPEGRLAELIIHELTHDVVYIKDSVDFNENLATFIGRKGAEGFLQHHFPNDSSYLLKYKKRSADKLLLDNFVRDWLPKFRKIYQEIKHVPTVQKEQLKYEIFEKFKNDLKQINFSNPNYATSIVNNNELNNAHLLSYKRYTGTQAVLEIEFEEKHHSDLKTMLNYYKNNFKSL
ncbi:aminopeptidase [Marivirga sp. S37H4]|uniref:Aminopeptidase n=1 Tax=Marivirga aurantiaca TaxID=2802615 RepID=A0A934WVB9_9BACT|nr:aminopeptidase [Marivirga aurantiaca]MBK6263616.1 aminopeptidase [Marivirga aurantiaca]